MSIAMIQSFKKTKLPPTERLVAYMLADHYNDSTGRCDPSFATLVDETGLSERTLNRSIKRIEEMGHLTVNRRVGARHSYDLHPCHGDSSGQKNGVTQCQEGDDTVAAPPLTQWQETPDTVAAESEVTVRTTGRELEATKNEMAAVLQNPNSESDPVVLKLYAIIRRPARLKMSIEEKALLRRACITDDDLALVERYFAADHPEWNGRSLRYKSLENLLTKWATVVSTAVQWDEQNTATTNDWEPDELQIILSKIFGRHPLTPWSAEERALYHTECSVDVSSSDVDKLRTFYASRRLTREQEFHRPKSLIDLLKRFTKTLDAARQFITPSAL